MSSGDGQRCKPTNVEQIQPHNAEQLPKPSELRRLQRARRPRRVNSSAPIHRYTDTPIFPPCPDRRIGVPAYRRIGVSAYFLPGSAYRRIGVFASWMGVSAYFSPHIGDTLIHRHTLPPSLPAPIHRYTVPSSLPGSAYRRICLLDRRFGILFPSGWRYTDTPKYPATLPAHSNPWREVAKPSQS